MINLIAQSISAEEVVKKGLSIPAIGLFFWLSVNNSDYDGAEWDFLRLRRRIPERSDNLRLFLNELIEAGLIVEHSNEI